MPAIVRSLFAPSARSAPSALPAWLALAALLPALAACVSVGREFPAESVAALEIGRTTQADARRLFGSPLSTGLEDGDVSWTYYRYRYSAFGPERRKDLVLRFGSDGVLRSYSFNETGQPAR